MRASINYHAFLLATLAASAFAEVPVVDAVQVNPSSVTSISQPALTQDQRLTQLEQQFNNLSQMGLLSQLKQLQQQVQELRGEIEVQGHDLKALQEQVRSQYQDIDQRLAAGKPMPVKAIPAVVPISAPEVKPVTKPLVTNAPTLADTDTYQVAYNLVKAKDYKQAEPALQKYLSQYPKGTFSGNAHYWLGEIYLSQGKTEQASQQFTTVIQQYPTSAKIAEAKLKLGFAYYDMGQMPQAKQQLQKVQLEYPGTSTARLAAIRLQTMQ